MEQSSTPPLGLAPFGVRPLGCSQLPKLGAEVLAVALVRQYIRRVGGARDPLRHHGPLCDVVLYPQVTQFQVPDSAGPGPVQDSSRRATVAPTDQPQL